ncbi:MAG TPA: tRNA (adenosine(37)-N6)-dimethylallyltransferase MiaA [Candidatus Nanopelagicales bacterium]|nr:tRNA (adenosine(37)-N6)-dimethylallyltransferase MiaA [Candidatus Nanopelagicales bacterium]
MDTGTGQPPVLAVVGPTAAGKSDLAVVLARRLGGEVVNADSMQLYRGMDIGTAKLTEAERGGVPHHLLDVWDVREPASVAAYQAAARAVVDRLRAAGVVPVLVGGSGLYLRAVLDDLRFPGTDPAVRARLEQELVEVGPAVLHARLAAQAPVAATAILPGNGRRIVRALEVVELTGTFTATLPALEPVYPAVRVGLEVPRPVLDERISVRVERMYAAGLVEEVRGLAARGLREGPTASRALGYAQVLAMLDGDCSQEQAMADTVRRTRRFARRQDSWFRREPVRWLAHDDPDLVERAVAAARAGARAGLTARRG